MSIESKLYYFEQCYKVLSNIYNNAKELEDKNGERYWVVDTESFKNAIDLVDNIDQYLKGNDNENNSI